ncbi:LysM peptidoglycan-binding domain-containing protein [Anaerosacchariphilus polymeriproducens]|uniref:LysM peptidoglycan-binding domain-containing protein n=1 Tax=Anaerosacchariphilus polymeriproducens TaxID=1812858 RepID=A0A371AYS9_9FIRM|nr:LysM peptidoglycan-binding domain-containing protein [Anaerosacchariphilus polymeriproducens]RDU24717.1 LysM peptidoglycan-binding domain-containing protein [Anaerosacchariphilus polymeriproducens]
MEIYIVQPNDTIQSIAEKYGITVEKLVEDNGLAQPNHLVIGQALVITFPKQTYIVQQGDTLKAIADSFDITIMQLIRNNPHLLDNETIYPGENLVISYNTSKSISTNGFSYPFMKQETLIKTLPYLTYLTIFNYAATKEGNIFTYQDESNIIKTSKEYGAVPIMLVSTLTPRGEQNIELAYNILLNETFQENHINLIIQIMKNKGYQGTNVIFYYLNENNQGLYLNFLRRMSQRFHNEGFLLVVSINYIITTDNAEKYFTKIDFSKFNELVDKLIFTRFVWTSNYIPPAPINNINFLRELIKYVSLNTPSNKIMISTPTIGYDWTLPYIPNSSNIYTLSLDAVMEIAYETNSVIYFDENSQTPYFYYKQQYFENTIQHIVWFIDARSYMALNQIIIDFNLDGNAIWNVMSFNSQLWTVLNTQFNIIKTNINTDDT